MKTIILFVIIGSSFQTSALTLNHALSKEDLMKSCSKRVNLLRKKWFVRSDSPQLDQGPTGLCYSYAASSYYDLWKQKQKIHQQKISLRILP